MIVGIISCKSMYAENYCLQREILSECLISPLIHDVSTSVEDCKSFAFKQSYMPIESIPKECRYH